MGIRIDILKKVALSREEIIIIYDRFPFLSIAESTHQMACLFPLWVSALTARFSRRSHQKRCGLCALAKRPPSSGTACP